MDPLNTQPTNVLVPIVVTAPTPSESRDQDLKMAIAGWLASYGSVGTREAYHGQFKGFGRWCQSLGLHPMEVRRPHIEMWARELEQRGQATSTVAHKLSTLGSFYKYAAEEEFLPKNPMAAVRRPKVDQWMLRPYLDRQEIGKFLAAAEGSDARDNALMCLLTLNGLRISEALGLNIETMEVERGHQTMKVLGKGNRPATIPLAPRTVRAVLTLKGERQMGPLFVGREGKRMERFAASRAVTRVAKRAGIFKHLTPHSLRRSFVTVSLDAGIPMRDVQLSARHLSPSTTARYDMGRRTLDSHATYVLSAFAAGG